jgi:hypothetical protein
LIASVVIDLLLTEEEDDPLQFPAGLPGLVGLVVWVLVAAAVASTWIIGLAAIIPYCLASFFHQVVVPPNIHSVNDDDDDPETLLRTLQRIYFVLFVGRFIFTDATLVVVGVLWTEAHGYLAWFVPWAKSVINTYAYELRRWHGNDGRYASDIRLESLLLGD